MIENNKIKLKRNGNDSVSEKNFKILQMLSDQDEKQPKRYNINNQFFAI